MRRGAATDLMEQVGDTLVVPRVASVADERPPCWWVEKRVRTKKQVSQVRSAKQDVPKRGFPRPKTMPRLTDVRGCGLRGKSRSGVNIKHARGR